MNVLVLLPVQARHRTSLARRPSPARRLSPAHRAARRFRRRDTTGALKYEKL